MVEAKQPITKLEDSIKRYATLVEILVYFTTVDERQSTLYATLVLVEEQISTLNDGRLNSLYQRLIEGQRTFMPKYGQLLNTDYAAFMTRLANLANEATIEANEADIALKEALVIDASTGIWGPKGWHPTITT